MSWPQSSDQSPYGPPPPGEGWPGPVPQSPATPVGPLPVSRTSMVVALFLVAVLAWSALFAAGFTLGLQQSLTPGTGDSEQELFAPFWEAYRKVTTEYVGAYEPKELVEGAIQGMFGALGDPYSSYMTSDEYRQSLQGIEGSFEGIGATMGSSRADGTGCTTLGDGCELVVEGVLPGSPAEQGGVLAGDRLVAVDDRSVEGSTLDEVVDWVRGPRGTDVRLSLLRDGEPVALTLTREVIERSAVEATTLADGRVGLVRVDGFSSGAADDLRVAIEEQRAAGAQGIILDLRDDPGGYVDAALEVASQFVADGPIYWDEYADGTTIPHAAIDGGVATDPAIPVVVLVNGGTASASEIVAGPSSNGTCCRVTRVASGSRSPNGSHPTRHGCTGSASRPMSSSSPERPTAPMSSSTAPWASCWRHSTVHQPRPSSSERHPRHRRCRAPHSSAHAPPPDGFVRRAGIGGCAALVFGVSSSGTKGGDVQ
jgi:C-terminal peptidase prc